MRSLGLAIGGEFSKAQEHLFYLISYELAHVASGFSLGHQQ